ncbi:MAG TPA: class I SAM-dependent methyltransferase [Gemmataceae bacterium]|jgi:ubiquinone/menaquinone biosynthesis C-methylase UbiE
MARDDKNYWLDQQCAQAFWDQRLALPYQELLNDTARWLDVRAGEHWLDLGCGCGQLTTTLWQRSGAQIGEIVSMDCNAVNAEAIDKLRRKLVVAGKTPPIRFVVGNFSSGLPQFADESFDGIVSGLAISYAESCDAQTGRYTDQAYNHLLAEMFRVLKPGGRLVFSVNVPHVRFWPIFWKSLRRASRISKPVKTLINSMRMLAYGHWLQREARRGRFHYFPIGEIEQRLRQVGFADFRFCHSYAKQAYVIDVRKAALIAQQEPTAKRMIAPRQTA